MPLEAAATSSVFRMFWLLMMVPFAYRSLATLWTGQRNGVFVSSGSARFRPLEGRSLGAGVNTTLGDFGLLMDGCEITTSKQIKWKDDNGLLIVDYGEDTKANGYFFTTSQNGDPSFDPMRWMVEVLTCAHEKSFPNSSLINGPHQIPTRWDIKNETAAAGTCAWKAVGASVWRMRAVGTDLFPLLPFPTPAVPRGQRVIVDHRIRWAQALDFSCATADWTLAIFGSSLAGCAGKPQLVPVFMGSAAGIDFVLSMASTIGFQLSQDWRDTAQGWLTTGSRLICFVGLVWFQHQVVWAILLIFVSSYAAYFIPTVFFYSVPALQALGVLSEIRPTAVLFFVIIAFRHRAFRRARWLLEADSRRYADAWAYELARPGADGWIREITCLASQVALNCPKHAFQYLDITRATHVEAAVNLNQLCASCRACRVGPSPIWKSFKNLKQVRHRHDATRGHDPNRLPVQSLDQLFVQAHCCHSILVQKVAAWAFISSGGFPAVCCRSEGHLSGTVFTTLQGEVFERCEVSDCSLMSRLRQRNELESHLPDGATSASLARNAVASGIRFAAVKSTSRAVEKAVRCYKKDVSLLLDLCRQSIVFRDGQDLVACLRAIVSDRDIAIVKIKNRMDPANPGGVACYRDVLLNLCLVTDEAKDMGVDRHVCEVQLLLQSFAAIKREEGHSRYVVFRNLRGE